LGGEKLNGKGFVGRKLVSIIVCGKNVGGEKVGGEKGW
jgi:hypothetical protein